MIRVRPSTLADLEGIREVSLRNGLSGFDPEERRRWWLSHPFRKEFQEVPMGWVLENDNGTIVGTFSNIHMMYEIDGKRLKCGIAGSWGVDTEFRSSSLLLAMSYLGQKEVDFCLNGSASDVASRLMTAMKAQQVPSEDYDLSYLWIISHQAFAAAALRKRKIPCGGIISYPLGLALRTSDSATGRSRYKNANLKRFEEFGTKFDEFWEEMRRGEGRLRAVRNSAVLEWRFGHALREGHAVVLGFLRGEKLCGYIVLSEKKRENLRLRQFVISDLQALNDSREIIIDLISAAIGATRENGLGALEWQGWNSAKRLIARELKPRSYRYPVWPLFYKAMDKDLRGVLSDAKNWDISPFDAF